MGAAAQTALTAAYESDGDSAHDLLGKAHAALRNVADADPQLAPPAALLAEAMINTQEAAEALRHYLDALDIDPARQEEIERHAAALEALARKHRVERAGSARRSWLRTETELRALDNAQLSLGKLELELAALTRDYRAAAQRLTEARKTAAEQLGSQITAAHAGARHGRRPVCGARRAERQRNSAPRAAMTSSFW